MVNDQHRSEVTNVNSKAEHRIPAADEAVGFDDLEAMLAENGVDLSDEKVSASLEEMRAKIEAGDLTLTQASIDESAAAIKILQNRDGELSEYELEVVAGGISPLAEKVVAGVGFVIGATVEGVTTVWDAVTGNS